MKAFRILTGFLLSLAFLFSVMGNIGRPLFWNDEGMTAMFARRVLQYGYPKVSDGKNHVYDLNHPRHDLGTDPATDAFIGGAGWGQYYAGALAEKCFGGIQDPYQRTALLRTSFALAGIAGFFLLIFLFQPYFRGTVCAGWIPHLLVTTAILSVSWQLHLREYRYYPWVVLLMAGIIGLYLRFSEGKMKAPGYITGVIFLMFLLLLTFSVAFVAVGAAALLHGLILLLRDPAAERKRRFIMRSLPFLLSLLMIIPWQMCFHVREISFQLQQYNKMTGASEGMWENLLLMYRYYSRHDLFYPALLMASLVFIFRKRMPASDEGLQKVRSLSLFLSVLIPAFVISVAVVPNLTFVRYHHAVMPLFWTWWLCHVVMASSILTQWLPEWKKGFLVLALGGTPVMMAWGNQAFLPGRWKELTRPVKGVLDHVTEWCDANVSDPSALVIAANYEESCLMYYLDAKVVWGYSRNFAQEDIRLKPDIIFFREVWMNEMDFEYLQTRLDTSTYEQVRLPVFPSRFNTIPELMLFSDGELVARPFQTPLPADADEDLVLWVRKGLRK